jgi:hypothetical protein
MKQDWLWNPKVKGSGIIECIPQSGRCPVGCSDCFFQSGRSYLEPLEETLPHIPPIDLSNDRIVRVNDGNDSNVDRDIVESSTQQFKDRFYNTSIPKDLGNFSAPVVLTINPSLKTDKSFHKLKTIPDNLDNVVKPAIEYYTSKGVAVVLTFMAYYSSDVPDEHKKNYIWKKRTINSYWCIKKTEMDKIMKNFRKNPFVYTCCERHSTCSFCGNCIREYYNAKERLIGNSQRFILESID